MWMWGWGEKKTKDAHMVFILMAKDSIRNPFRFKMSGV